VQDEMHKKANALADKEAIIELVEQEIMKIKDAQDGDRRQVQEKEALIEELSVINDQLQRQNDTKADEIRVLIDKMESYK
jgi:FtsZ-binding cell division protein ZapB